VSDFLNYWEMYADSIYECKAVGKTTTMRLLPKNTKSYLPQLWGNWGSIKILSAHCLNHRYLNCHMGSVAVLCKCNCLWQSICPPFSTYSRTVCLVNLTCNQINPIYRYKMSNIQVLGCSYDTNKYEHKKYDKLYLQRKSLSIVISF
jgi:hypothetical protein